MPFSNPVVGGTTLIRPAMASPNYVQGSSGWSVNSDGSAEFNHILIRNGESVSGTSLYYNGTPGAGTLVISISATAGTDTYGNAYVAGYAVYGTGGTVEYQVDLSGNVTIGKTTTGGFQLQPGSIPVLQVYDDLGRLAANIDANSGIVTFLDSANAQFIQFNVNNTGVLGGMILGSMSAPGTMPSLTEQQQAGAVTLDSTGAELLLVSPTASTATKAAQARLLPGQPNTSTGQAGVPQLLVQADVSANPSDVDMVISGSIVKGDRTNNNQPFTWQAPVLGSGWASGPASGTVQPLQYRLGPTDNLLLDGAIHSTSTAPAATVFVLPAAYRPVTTRRGGIITNTSGTWSATGYEINSDGNVVIAPTPTASGVDVYFEIDIPLGHQQ